MEPASGGPGAMPEPHSNFIFAAHWRVAPDRTALYRDLRDMPRQIIVSVTQTTTQKTRPPHQYSPSTANEKFPLLCFVVLLGPCDQTPE
jgi:hypothetical protein